MLKGESAARAADFESCQQFRSLSSGGGGRLAGA
jgi:hypothetical protein